MPVHLIDSVTAANEEFNLVTESNFRDRAVYEYSSKGTARGGFAYFRFSYKEGSRVRHVHIGGGNVRSAIAQARAALVSEAVREGMSNLEIVRMIKTVPNAFTANSL